MGILPLEIPRDFVDLEPGDSIRVEAVEVSPRCQVPVTVTKVDGSTVNYLATATVETGIEAQLLVDGGVIPSIPFFPSQQESDNYDELGEKVDSLPLNFENLGRTEHFSGPAETVRVDEDNQLL